MQYSVIFQFLKYYSFIYSFIIILFNHLLPFSIYLLLNCLIGDVESIYIREPEPNDSDDDRSVLGKGVFGITHRMKSRHDGRVYAVKVVDLKHAKGINLKSLKDEASLLADLTHANIVRYFTSFSSKRERYFNLVMELVIGGTLEEVFLPPAPRASLAEWKKIASQLTAALVYMHSLRVLHRDLKPDNILLTPHPRRDVKIADLGNACVLRATGGRTARGGGAVVYSSYEKAHGIPIGGEDDMWAVGCILGELATHTKLDSPLYETTLSDVEARRRQLIASCSGWDGAVGRLVGVLLTPRGSSQPSSLTSQAFQAALTTSLSTVIKLLVCDVIRIINNRVLDCFRGHSSASSEGCCDSFCS